MQNGLVCFRDEQKRVHALWVCGALALLQASGACTMRPFVLFTQEQNVQDGGVTSTLLPGCFPCLTRWTSPQLTLCRETQPGGPLAGSIQSSLEPDAQDGGPAPSHPYPLKFGPLSQGSEGLLHPLSRRGS